MADTSKGYEIFEYTYDKCLNGIPKVSKPVEDLVRDYVEKYGNTAKAIDKLIRNQSSKNSINGFVTSFGGFVTLPDNIINVIYIQMRMVASIAVIRGYDLKNDDVQTFIYACVVGNATIDIIKSSGIKVTNKLGQNLVSKIPEKVFIDLNKK